MIINKSIKIRINNRQVKYYKSRGYSVKGGDDVLIEIKDLTLNSNVLVDVICDNCKTQKQVQYNDYNKYTNNQKELYLCHKCNDVKRKITNNKKYGCDNVFQNKKIKEKRKDTMIELYGDEHALNITQFKDKAKQTNNERFGLDYASQNDDIKQKIEDTFMRNYCVKTSLLDPVTIEKIKETNKELYGVDNVFKVRHFKEDAMFKIYGFEYPFQVNEIKDKAKETLFKNYNVENPMQNKNIQEKSKRTKIERGSYLTDEQRMEYKNYWLKVKVFTNKNKKQLFENWDGIDFYDNEYIKENFYLPSGNREYPTIDHKISVSYGFKNNISAEEIGKLENLCITKRSINSSKNNNCEYKKREQ